MRASVNSPQLTNQSRLVFAHIQFLLPSFRFRLGLLLVGFDLSLGRLLIRFDPDLIHLRFDISLLLRFLRLTIQLLSVGLERFLHFTSFSVNFRFTAVTSRQPTDQ